MGRRVTPTFGTCERSRHPELLPPLRGRQTHLRPCRRREREDRRPDRRQNASSFLNPGQIHLSQRRICPNHPSHPSVIRAGYERSVWHFATLCDIVPPMAKSIRVSDRLYSLAEATSQQLHRSLAQQVEHWAELGRALEAAGITTAQVLSILSGDLRARERLMLKLGLATQESMYLFPVDLAQRTKVSFPELRKKGS
jgi:ParD-like antitoxin of type II bacterial toxin-antitoxin system